MTQDVPQRMVEHARRQTRSTKRFTGALGLIYRKEFKDHASARRHEKYLKSGSGRKGLSGLASQRGTLQALPT